MCSYKHYMLLLYTYLYIEVVVICSKNRRNLISTKACLIKFVESAEKLQRFALVEGRQRAVNLYTHIYVHIHISSVLFVVAFAVIKFQHNFIAISALLHTQATTIAACSSILLGA